jgi:hypothetical protein
MTPLTSSRSQPPLEGSGHGSEYFPSGLKVNGQERGTRTWAWSRHREAHHRFSTIFPSVSSKSLDEDQSATLADKLDSNRKKPPESPGILALSRWLRQTSAPLPDLPLRPVVKGATPGVDFGQAGKRAVRFSYASSEENIREAARRFAGYLRKR